MNHHHPDRTTINLLISNDYGSLSRIIIEPWADEIDIRAGDQVFLTASGPHGTAQIEQEVRGDILIVSALRGWTIEALLNGAKIDTASATIESI